MRKLSFLIFICLVFTTSAAEPLKIAVISDLHYLSKDIAKPGVALNSFEQSTGRNVSDLHEVLDVVFDRLENENIDVLLVTGDITNHGSKKSHQAFANKLYTLKHNGIQTYVIPGNHDVNIPNSKSYIGDKAKVIESVSTEEFAKIYGSFGYGNALSRDAHSLSYLSELNDSTWLMSIDTNKFAEYTNSSISSGRILSSTMSWAIDILREAKRKNIIVLGMMHHGIVEHIQYQSTFFSDYLLDNWQDNAEILADEGLKIIFTGHFHSTDAAEFITYKGNKIVDVETGSLAQYPFPFRIIKLKNYELNIDTHFVESIPDNPDLWKDYIQKQEKYVRNLASSKFNNMGIPFPEEMIEILTEVIVKVNLMHLVGDEQVTPEMTDAIQRMATMMGVPKSEQGEFELDYPPADKKLNIPL